MDESASMKFEMSVMKGVILRQEHQITSLIDKVNDLTARQMSDNVVITSIPPPNNVPVEEVNPTDGKKQPKPKPKEDCIAAVSTFLRDEIGLTIEEDGILVAHRIGKLDQTKGQQMIARCTPRLRDKILQNSKNLAKKVNINDQPMYVNLQVPENMVAERRENSAQIKKIKETNIGKPFKLRTSYHFQNRKMFVDGYPLQKLVKSPQLDDLLPEVQEQEKMEKLKFWYSEPVQDKGNIFTGVALKVSSPTEVRRAYRRIRQIYAGASHVSLGFECMKQWGNNDDLEYGAGLAIQTVMQENNVNNKAVFVIRQASGVRLGPKRFQIIKYVVQDVIAKIK